MDRKDNRGASLVMVVIAMAIVAVLAVTVLWISLANLQMKVTDKKTTDNFYSAEGVLDQICTGLQEDVSLAYSAGYKQVSESYTDKTEDERKLLFNDLFIKTLCGRLSGSDAIASYSSLSYDLSKLIGYVDDSLLDENKYPYAKITVTTGTKDGYGLLAAYTSRVVIKGLKVEYTDEKGFKSVIETDISLSVPDIKFTPDEAIPDIFSYSIIGNEGLTLSNSKNSVVNLDGNVYAGSPFVVGTDTADTDSVLIPDNVTLNVEKTSYFIAEGSLNIGQAKANTSGNAVFNVSNECQLWTENLNVKGSSAKLKGSTFASDDLTLSGVGSDVVLGQTTDGDASGKYIGYGYGDDASKNSAVIVNGKDSTLDMSQLNQLMVSGYAYINTSALKASTAASSTTVKNSNVATGESISVKGNQIAYLVPAECIGTVGNGETADASAALSKNANAKSKYNKNPITYAEYQELTKASESATEAYTLINTEVVSSKTGHALKDYGITQSNIDSYIKKVFVQKNSADTGLVYFYVDLPSAQASNYYKDYFNADNTKLAKYTDFYTNAIKVNDDAEARINAAGWITTYDSETGELAIEADGLSDSNAALERAVQSDALSKTYKALNTKLITDYKSLSSAEKADSAIVFTNLIDMTQLQKFLSGSSTSKKFIASVTTGDVTKTYKAIVKDGNYTYDGSDNKDGEISLIIATGDVTLEADFKGTILAKGKVYTKNGCKNISNNTQEVFRALLLSQNNDTYLYKLFKSGENYLSGDDKNDSLKNGLDYTSLITYENWSKN